MKMVLLVFLEVMRICIFYDLIGNDSIYIL